MSRLADALGRWPPRLLAAPLLALVAAAWLGLGGQDLAVGDWRPLDPPSARLALWLVLAWALACWGLRRSPRGPLLALACLLVAGAGPALAWGEHHPLRPAWARAGLIAVLALAGIACAVLRSARQRAQAATEALQALWRLFRPASGRRAPLAADLAAQVRRVQQQWLMLHGAAGWRGWLLARRQRRRLAWYLVLGPPGSGKSALLEASALRLLPCEAADTEPHAGVCRWWLGERAVFAELRDSDSTPAALATAAPAGAGDAAAAIGSAHPAPIPGVAPPDAADGATPTPTPTPTAAPPACAALLQALRQRGAATALHGVVLIVDVATLMHESAVRVSASARDARQRLWPLRAELATRPPLYLVLNKADILPGFGEFFEALDGRGGSRPAEMLWGFVLAWPEPGAHHPLRQVRAELDLLGRRLQLALPGCLEHELELQRRCHLYELPHAYAELARRLLGWLEIVFAQAPAALPQLRGVYLSSSLDRGDLATAARPEGAGRFAGALLGGVLLADSARAGAGAVRPRHPQLRRALAAMACLLPLLAGWWLLAQAQRQSQAGLLQLQRLAGSLQAAWSQVPRASGPDGLLAAQARADALVDGVRFAPLDWPLAGALLQPVREAADGVLLRLRQALLLPGLLRRMRQVLATAMRDNDIATVSDTLALYLWLHDPAQADASRLRRWALRHAGPGLAQALLRPPQLRLRDPLPADAELLRQTREWLARSDRGQRLWHLLERALPAQLQPPAFTLAGLPGSELQRPLRLASGRPLTQGVAGWYTLRGWQWLAPRLAALAERADEADRRLLGGGAAPPSPATTETQLRDAYWMRYALRWSSFLQDVRAQPMPDLPAQLELLRRMGGDASPVLELARRAAEQLQPLQRSGLGTRDPRASALLELAAATSGGADSARSRLRGWLDTYYTAASMAASVIAAAGAPGDALALAAARLRAQAATLPAPLAGVLASLEHDTTALLLGAGSSVARAQAEQSYRRIAGAYREQVAEPCARDLAGRFPLQAGGSDADFDAFVEWLRPGGSAQRYFDSYLLRWVDTSRTPWRYREDLQPGDAVPQIDGRMSAAVANSLLELLRRQGPDPRDFARIARLRSALWRGAAAAPSWSFALSVPDLDPRLIELRIDFDGQRLRYVHGPVQPWRAIWPGPRPATSARLRLQPDDGRPALELLAQGPWAWLHLLAQGRPLRSAATGTLDLQYDLRGRHAVLRLQSADPDPWQPGLLPGFACPR